MGWSKANKWCTSTARSLANNVADLTGYCGPAVVAWIAAVWERSKGRSYDYETRLADKDLFPDGPKTFTTLSRWLKRETHGDLKLGSFYMPARYGTLHDRLEEFDMPIVIRMYPDDIGLHYVTLYKSYKQVRKWKFDRIKFYWQDNGVYGEKNGGNPGLYGTDYRAVGESAFLYGAKRVTRA